MIVDKAATCRTRGDAPEIDGDLYIDEDFAALRSFDVRTGEVETADDYDLWGRRCGERESRTAAR